MFGLVDERKEKIKYCVKSELEQWENGIKKGALLKFSIGDLPNENYLIKVKIQNGEVKAINRIELFDRFDTIMKFLQKCVTPDMDLDMIISIRDGCNFIFKDFPIFVFSKNIGNANICIPNPYLIQGWPGSKITVKSKTSFLNRMPKAIFAGTDTGECAPERNQRLQFCKWSLNHRDFIDAWITRIRRLKEGEISKTIPEYKDFIRSRIGIDEQLRYRYLINIDGNFSSWSRLPWILMSGSICLYFEPRNVEWFYHLLEDKKHLYTVTYGNILDTIKWCEKNKEEIYKVAHNGVKFARTYLTTKSQRIYMQTLLQEYRKLLS